MAGAGRNVRSPLQDYLDDGSDSRIPRWLAIQSRLPNLGLYQKPGYQGAPRQNPGTSLMMSGTDSLAALTIGSSNPTTASVATEVGERGVDSKQQFLRPRGGVLEVPAPRRQPFECPFHFLYCLLSFISFDDWFSHSLTHFQSIGPPRSNTCYFCEQRFEASTGRRSWEMLFEHVKLHHELGHTLAHARPNCELYAYLWYNGLISRADYKALGGGLAQQAYPSPPTSPSDDENPTAYTVTNRRGKRHR